jgi:thiol:disulfide interchange protein DsbA
VKQLTLVWGKGLSVSIAVFLLIFSTSVRAQTGDVSETPSSAASEAAMPLQTAGYQEGVNYERLPVAVEARDPSKIEVVEVFSYACIHCKTFEPAVEAWAAEVADDIDFYRMPATFNQTWTSLAQGYYTAEALGVLDQVHEAMFRTIHDRGVNVADPELMAQLFEAAAGVPPAQFNQVFNSFSVRSRVQQADARGRVYRITGTPTMIVDGTYRVDARMAGSHENMLEVVDFLVEQQRSAGQSAAGAEAGQ